MAANIGDNVNLQIVPKPIWEVIFSRLSPTDARAAALSCRLFAAIYRDLHPLQTESRREALAGLQKEIIVHSTRVANIGPIQNLPTYGIRYNGSNTFELFHGNDRNEVKMKFVLPSEQSIEYFSTRLCRNNSKLVIGYIAPKHIGMAIFNWKDQKCEKDHHFPKQGVRYTFYHDDTIMIVTFEELISSEPDGTILTKPLPEKVLPSDVVISHLRKPYLLINKAQPFSLIWNCETGRTISLIHPAEIQKKVSFSVVGCGFFESSVFLSWSTDIRINLKLTYERYYDLSKMDSEDELISSRNFTLRNKSYTAVKVVSEKYLVRMERRGNVECDTIRDRIRLWSIKVKTFDIGRTYTPRLLNFPIDDPYVIIKDPRYKIILNVATGEMKKINTYKELICLVHSDKGPCFFFLGGNVNH